MGREAVGGGGGIEDYIKYNKCNTFINPCYWVGIQHMEVGGRGVRTPRTPSFWIHPYIHNTGS